MDWIRNPFSPGAGSPPPELAGRDAVLQQARVLFGRVRARRAEKSLLLTGLRGVGKTVLLNEMERMAGRDGYRTVLLEAQESRPLALLLVPHLRRLLFDLDRIAAAGYRARRAIAVLKSFIGSIKVSVGDVEFGIDVEPERGAADSGDLETDPPNLLAAVAEAAEERATAVALLVDEIQYCSSAELSALIMAMHRMQQRQLPLVLVGAGLPILPGLAGEAKPYAERLFAFPDVGPLEAADAARALRQPIEGGRGDRGGGARGDRPPHPRLPVLPPGVGLPGVEPGREVADHAGDGADGDGAGHGAARPQLLPRALRPADAAGEDIPAGDGVAGLRSLPHGRHRGTPRGEDHELRARACEPDPEGHGVQPFAR